MVNGAFLKFTGIFSVLNTARMKNGKERRAMSGRKSWKVLG